MASNVVKTQYDRRGRKIADCDYGPRMRVKVAIGVEGYVKTPYITGELLAPAEPRESRAPKPRGSTSFLRIKNKRNGK